MGKNGGVLLIIDCQVMNVVRVLKVGNQHFVTMMIVTQFKQESVIAVYFDGEENICTALKYQYQMIY